MHISGGLPPKLSARYDTLKGCSLPSRLTAASKQYTQALLNGLGKAKLVFCQLNNSHRSRHATRKAALSSTDRLNS